MYLSPNELEGAIRDGAVAIRRVQRLQPAGGQGDKVFPPTYEGGEYATEIRVINGERLDCVLLDSVQSQANRMELALKQACYRGPGVAAEVPVVSVDFAGSGLPEVGEITSLDAPHRLADAIFRDSLLDGMKFRQSVIGQTLDKASLVNATGLYELCPTALIFGIWDSTGPRGGLGMKFQRALVGEIIGIDVSTGVKPSSRLDPLGILKESAEVYRLAGSNDWTLDPEAAEREKGKPVKFGKDGKPSEINHGNVTPSLRNKDKKLHSGGVTLQYAQQTVVLSLPALRRLNFPDASGQRDADRDLRARVALASLGICAAEWSIRQGCDLRSRCLLIPDVDQPAFWEIVRSDGSVAQASIEDPMALLQSCSAAAEAAGLPRWRRDPVVLQPSAGLIELVKRSRAMAAAAAVEE